MERPAKPFPTVGLARDLLGYASDVIGSWAAGDGDVGVSTRQLWVLQAVATGRIDRDPWYGGLCTLEGRSVWWTMVVLALRGLIVFDVAALGPPHLTRRGQARLRGW